MYYQNSNEQYDYGPNPYVGNIRKITAQNQNFRAAVWTGCYMQMTVMSIPPCGEIGVENHEDTDQLIRIEHGRAIVKMGETRNLTDYCVILNEGDVVFVPAGTWHNVVNTQRRPLQVSSIYAPPHHPHGTLQRTREDAEMEENY